MKAQISLETLLVLLFGLALLGAAMVAVNKIGALQSDAAYSSMLQKAADNVASSADEICTLGEGNSRTVQLPKFEIRMKADGGAFAIFAKGANATRRTICPLSLRNGNFTGEIYLWFDEVPAQPGEMPKIIASASIPGQ